MAKSSYSLNRDGRTWIVTPGKNGSYISKDKTQMTPMKFEAPARPAKVITAPFTGEDPMKSWSYLSKRKSKIIPGTPPSQKTNPVASSRG